MKYKLLKPIIPFILIFSPIIQTFAKSDDTKDTPPPTSKTETSQTAKKSQGSESALPTAKTKPPNLDEKPSDSEKTVASKPKAATEKTLNFESEKPTDSESDLKKETKPQKPAAPAASIIPRKVSEKKSYKKSSSEPSKKSENLSKKEIIKLIIKDKHTSKISDSQDLKLDLPQVSDDEIDNSISFSPDLPEKVDSKNWVSTVMSGLILLIIVVFISALIFYNFKIPQEYDSHFSGKHFNKKNTLHIK